MKPKNKPDNENMNEYQRTLFFGIILIALGIVFSTNLSESFGSLGIIFIAIGGLFFIIGMSTKKKDDDNRINK